MKEVHKGLDTDCGTSISVKGGGRLIMVQEFSNKLGAITKF